MDAALKQKIQAFFGSYPKHEYTKGQILIQPEQPLQHVFYVTDGIVTEYDITPNGNQVVVNIFKPGAFFPMSLAINGGDNPYVFEAHTTVTAHVAPPQAAVQFLQDNPNVTFNLLSRVYKGTDGVLRRMAHLMSGDTRQRLVFELLNAAQRFGTTPDDNYAVIPFSEGDLAKHSGMARETVSRHLQQFKSAGLITIDAKGITIADIKALQATLGSYI